MKEYSRNKIQELSAIALYDVLTYSHMGEAVDVEGILSDLYEAPFEDVPLFSKEIVVSFIKNQEEEISLIESHMKNWTFDRLNRMEQAILLEAVTNYYHREEKTDKKIVISVALELAHKYLDDGRYKFDNAILDNILKD